MPWFDVMKAPTKGCKPILYLYSGNFHQDTPLHGNFHHDKKSKIPLYTCGSSPRQPSMHPIETLPERVYMTPAIGLNHGCAITGQPRHEPCQLAWRGFTSPEGSMEISTALGCVYRACHCTRVARCHVYRECKQIFLNFLWRVYTLSDRWSRKKLHV